jgi:hypothetical protein
MPDAEYLRHTLLKFLHQGSVIGQPTTVQHLINTLQQSFAVANIGPADMQFLRKGRCATKKRQIL